MWQTGRSPAAGSLPPVFRSALAQVKARSHVQVFLPSELPKPIGKAKHAVVDTAAAGGYWIALYYELGVGNAGFAGAFGGTTAGQDGPQDLPNVHEVKLAGGLRGFFRPVSCGGSCAPANLWWEAGGALYQIEIELAPTLSDRDQERILILVANSAILAGPR